MNSLKTGILTFELDQAQYLSLEEGSDGYYLTVKEPIIPLCRECRKEINTDKEELYYCPDDHFFFHKKCCINSKHHTKHQKSNTHWRHEDIRVILIVKE